MANSRAGKWVSRLVAGSIAATAVMSLAARAGFADAWDDTVKAAESEGVVTVVGPPIPFHRASIETFRAAYPKIRLDLSGLTPSEYEPKIAAERKASIYSWDVMVSGMGPSTYNVYI